jgi:hypothetical protein
MNNIIKLSSGETIITEIVNRDDYGTTIMDPLAIDIAENGDGSGTMVALSWLPLKKGTEVTLINLNTSHIIAIGEIDEEVDLYYRKALAMIKGDAELLREVILEETTDEEVEMIREQIEDDLESLRSEQTANTVH